MALLRPLFAGLACVQPAAVSASTTGEGAALVSVRLVGVASVSHCMADTRGEGAALASVCLVGVVSASHGGGGHNS
jgi:hypothetical protein